MDEYEARNGSEYSISLTASTPSQIDDDSITVSSKDMGYRHDVYRSRGGPKTILSGPKRDPVVQRPTASQKVASPAND